MNKDFSELEGKEIDYVCNNGKILKGIVIGCDYDIGITVVNKDHKDHNLVCLNGASSPNKKAYSEEAYKTYFFCVIAMIKKGKFKAGLAMDVWYIKKYGKVQSCNGILASCAFS